MEPVAPVPIQHAHPLHVRGLLEVHRHGARRIVGPDRIAVVGAGGVYAIDQPFHSVGLGPDDRGASRDQRQIRTHAVIQRGRHHHPVQIARRGNPEHRGFRVGVFIRSRRQGHGLPGAPIRRRECPRRPALDRQIGIAGNPVYREGDIFRRSRGEAQEDTALAVFPDQHILGADREGADPEGAVHLRSRLPVRIASLAGGNRDRAGPGEGKHVSGGNRGRAGNHGVGDRQPAGSLGRQNHHIRNLGISQRREMDRLAALANGQRAGCQALPVGIVHRADHGICTRIAWNHGRAVIGQRHGQFCRECSCRNGPGQPVIALAQLAEFDLCLRLGHHQRARRRARKVGICHGGHHRIVAGGRRRRGFAGVSENHIQAQGLGGGLDFRGMAVEGVRQT